MLIRRDRRFAIHRFYTLLLVILGNATQVILVDSWNGCAAAEAIEQSREDRLRAGYLLNFAKFVEWPSLKATEPLSVCFIGGAGIHAAFDTIMSGKSIGNHALITHALGGRIDAAGCRMVYIDANVAASSDYLGGTTPPAALTVGDAPDFLARGGIIEMFTKDNRLRFNISLVNARRASLHIGSDLLQLAVRVEDGNK